MIFNVFINTKMNIAKVGKKVIFDYYDGVDIIEMIYGYLYIKNIPKNTIVRYFDGKTVHSLVSGGFEHSYFYIDDNTLYQIDADNDECDYYEEGEFIDDEDNEFKDDGSTIVYLHYGGSFDCHKLHTINVCDKFTLYNVKRNLDIFKINSGSLEYFYTIEEDMDNFSSDNMIDI